MSISTEEFLVASPSQTVDANVFMHEELMKLLTHYDMLFLLVITVLRVIQKGNLLLTSLFSKKEQN